MDLSALAQHRRLLMEADLVPLQGTRFQPTGFADLGPATFMAPDGTRMLVVESHQSVANRLESVCWNEVDNHWTTPLQGLPYVQVMQGSRPLTNSVLEAHRLNSPYILEGEDRSFLDTLKSELLSDDNLPVDIRRLAQVVFKYDPNSILHGLFLAKKDLAGGRYRLMRLLAGFIEATGVREAESGGVKNDRVDPRGDTRRGFGNVPFHRTEFVAERITAYFDLDLGTLRAYGLGEDAETLLIALALWKVQRFLASGLRLRTACSFDVIDFRVTRPAGLEIPSLGQLSTALPELIASNRQAFADPPVTTIQWEGTTRSATAKDGDDSDLD